MLFEHIIGPDCDQLERQQTYLIFEDLVEELPASPRLAPPQIAIALPNGGAQLMQCPGRRDRQ